jgi:hypothetical protein
MSSPLLEAFLARLYTDEAALEAFLEMPADEARNAGLAASEVAALLEVDRDGLVMAARGFRVKLQARSRRARGIIGFATGLSRRVGPWARRIVGQTQ